MATQANSKPVRSAAPVIRYAPAMTGGGSVSIFRFLPAAIISAVVHIGLGAGLYFLASPDTQAGNLENIKDKQQQNKEEAEQNTVKEDPQPVKDDEPPPPATDDVNDEPELKLDKDDINLNIPREGDFTVPGEVDLNEPAGTSNASDGPKMSFTGPQGLGGGTGGAATEGVGDVGTYKGTGGGYLNGSAGPLKPGSIYGRSGQTKKMLLKADGGTEESERAVNNGLDWLARHQAPDGHWSLNHFHLFGNHGRTCNCRDESNLQDDTAATAFGVLPFLGAGYTHLGSKDKLNPNPWHRNVARAIGWLMRHQKPNGDLRTSGSNMYSHGLATIALCEDYGLTQDRKLKRSAQAAVNFIVRAQHPGGGWRYQPGMQGDTSVVGWQVMALKSAQMANLNVPARTMKLAERYLDSVMNQQTYGYGYMGSSDATPTRTAVGLLCRQYLQGLGPASPIMANAVKNYIKAAPPVSGKNMYYYYYATQVLHHFGGPNWVEWNSKMRDILIREQVPKGIAGHQDEWGSWSPVGDPHGAVGGRVMQTSLSILTLEVYYRYLPLYRRDIVDKKELAGK